MKKLFKTTLASALLMVSAFASAVTVKDAKGEFTLDKTPSRVVVLEDVYKRQLQRQPLNQLKYQKPLQIQPHFLAI